VVPRNAEPTIEIRELHSVQDANVALHALADAQEAFQSTFGPDPLPSP
jgi:hypothetical protein